MSFVQDKQDRTIRGMGDFTFVNLDTGVPVNVLSPSRLQIAHGTVQQRIPTTNSAGFQIQGAAYPVGFDYTAQVSFNVFQPELLEMKMGSLFESVTNRTLTMVKKVEVYATSMPALTSGDFGYNISADPTGAKATVTVNNVSTLLSRVSFSSHDASVNNTYAIGANGSLKFATNLLNKAVTLTIPYSVTGRAWGADPLPQYSVHANFVTTDGETVIVEIPKVSVNLDGSGFMPGGGIDLAFFIVPIAGRKIPYELIYTGETI